MKLRFPDWRSLWKELGWKAILDSYLAGFMFATFVFVPLYVALASALAVYLYLLYWLVSGLMLLTILYVGLTLRLARKAMILKQPLLTTHLNRLLWHQWLGSIIVILAIGLFIIFVMIPIWNV